MSIMYFSAILVNNNYRFTNRLTHVSDSSPLCGLVKMKVCYRLYIANVVPGFFVCLVCFALFIYA